jgi:hypothetical protein
MINQSLGQHRMNNIMLSGLYIFSDSLQTLNPLDPAFAGKSPCPQELSDLSNQFVVLANEIDKKEPTPNCIYNKMSLILI